MGSKRICNAGSDHYLAFLSSLRFLVTLQCAALPPSTHGLPAPAPTTQRPCVHRQAAAAGASPSAWLSSQKSWTSPHQTAPGRKSCLRRRCVYICNSTRLCMLACSPHPSVCVGQKSLGQPVKCVLTVLVYVSDLGCSITSCVRRAPSLLGLASTTSFTKRWAGCMCHKQAPGAADCLAVHQQLVDSSPGARAQAVAQGPPSRARAGC